MAIYLLLFITVLVLGLISIWWERRWKAHRSAAAAAQESGSQPDLPLKQAPTNGIGALWAKFAAREQSPQLVDRFRPWANEALANDAEVRHWLNRLSTPAYAAFVEHVEEFAAEMGFSLMELVDGRMAQLPRAAQSATGIILNYCRANQQAALAQGEFDGYRAFAAYLAEPTKADNQRFIQQLYAKLVEQKVAPEPTPERLALTETERLLQMQDAVRQAATKPEAFCVVLNAVAAERRRTAADVTVAGIVQEAMTKVIKPVTSTPTDTPVAGQHEEEAG